MLSAIKNPWHYNHTKTMFNLAITDVLQIVNFHCIEQIPILKNVFILLHIAIIEHISHYLAHFFTLLETPV